MMRAILIDAAARTITEIDIEKGADSGAHALERAIGCDIFQMAMNYPNGDVLYVDEEGLLKPAPHWFRVRSGHQAFAGNGVLLGSDNQGESVDVKTTLDDLRATVTFMSLHEIRVSGLEPV